MKIHDLVPACQAVGRMKEEPLHLLSPPVNIARWAHMHPFAPVRLSGLYQSH